MSLVISDIVEVSMDKLALWINVCVDGWTAELAIIASNFHWMTEIYTDIISQFAGSFAADPLR